MRVPQGRDAKGSLSIVIERLESIAVMNGVSVCRSGVWKPFGRIECVRTLNLNGAPSRVDMWRRREGLTSHATLTAGRIVPSEDCSLEAFLRRCGTVSRREVPKEVDLANN